MERGERPAGKLGPSFGVISGGERGEIPLCSLSIICKGAVVAPSSAFPKKGVATVPVGFFLDLSWFGASFPPASFVENEWAASESTLPA